MTRIASSRTIRWVETCLSLASVVCIVAAMRNGSQTLLVVSCVIAGIGIVIQVSTK